MRIAFSATAWEQYLWWQTTDRKTLKRINLLIRDILRDDLDSAIGKPERLKGDFSGYSSRRIDDEHRLVYRLDAADDGLFIAQCRYHYGKH